MNTSVIDDNGLRRGVGIILANDNKQLFLAKRLGRSAWQFPQGGVHTGEALYDALFRELWEEVGLKPENVEVLSCTKCWLSYNLPKHLIRRNSKPICLGQKQKWFLLKLIQPDSCIDLAATEDPEFDDWRWVSYWYPLSKVIAFKRQVYLRAMREFAPVVLSGKK